MHGALRLRATFEQEIATIRQAPEAINIYNIRTNSRNGNFEKTLSFGRFKKMQFSLREAVRDPATANLSPG